MSSKPVLKPWIESRSGRIILPNTERHPGPAYPDKKEITLFFFRRISNTAQNTEHFDTYDTDEKGKPMYTAKKFVQHGSGSASRGKVGSGSTLKRCRSTTLPKITKLWIPRCRKQLSECNTNVPCHCTVRIRNNGLLEGTDHCGFQEANKYKIFLQFFCLLVTKL